MSNTDPDDHLAADLERWIERVANADPEERAIVDPNWVLCVLRFAKGYKEEAERTRAEVICLRQATAAFLDAVTGDPEKSQWRVGWLESLLTDIDSSSFCEHSPDPSAAVEAVHHCRDLARLLRAAAEKVRGGT